MRRAVLIAFAALLAGCAASPNKDALAPPQAQPAAQTQDVAQSFPVAGPGRPLPTGAITQIAFGSCNTAEQPIPILRQIAADGPDLFVYTGDNVYGDAKADMSLPELRAQYEKLAAHEDFQALRAVAPMLATWDDHDYGLNDAGAEFPAKALSQQMFGAFWGVSDRLAGRDGVYDSYIFGPAGQRVQVILLDTRYARSALKRLPERGPMGPYTPQTDEGQQMLSPAQWFWLAQELKKPADLRFVVSSIQVLADGHDFEAWENLPREQARLYETIRASGAKGVVFVSGDRHSAGLYRQEGLIGYPAYELTASSLNRAFRETSDEMSTNQLGAMYAPVNYGTAAIDWAARTLTLQVKDLSGAPVRERQIAFGELGL